MMCDEFRSHPRGCWIGNETERDGDTHRTCGGGGRYNYYYFDIILIIIRIIYHIYDVWRTIFYYFSEGNVCARVSGACVSTMGELDRHGPRVPPTGRDRRARAGTTRAYTAAAAPTNEDARLSKYHARTMTPAAHAAYKFIANLVMCGVCLWYLLYTIMHYNIYYFYYIRYIITIVTGIYYTGGITWYIKYYCILLYNALLYCRTMHNAHRYWYFICFALSFSRQVPTV